jgi:apolipoprotein D and lipocalin family protein
MKILSIFIVILLVAAIAFVMVGRTGIPEGVTAVQGFDAKRFLGTWYEVARLDHGFEKGLNHVTAEYSLRDDGGLKVINKGFDPKKGLWSESEAKAYFIETPDVGRLKVSFFGPFYGSYNIIDLDQKDYSWALVTGPSKNYLWMLSRSKTPDNAVMVHMVEKAKSLGFKLEKLIYVDQKDASLPPAAVPGSAAPAPAPAQ